MVIGDVIEYEILLLLDTELPDDREEQIVQRIREEIERGGGTWERHDSWGQRKLAYEIDHKADGSYHLLQFQSGPETLAEISRVLKITDGVIRHMAVRRPKPPKPKPPRREPEGEARAEPEPELETVREGG
jgi:small subunit ribosomal protein S6